MPLSPGSRLRLWRSGVLAPLLVVCWTAPQVAPAWAAHGPTARPAAQEAPAHGHSARGGAGDGLAGLVPIAIGLLLTGVAVYKHRGLPGGH
ncbi:hypothetical protein ABIA33_006764 [Streptacidiphilus sp. MAP12-16]|uniref:hypothetical protein n=1 Tax=Streptacidiphilus sp. MAP12-16 TaxID=3156300 RepID=UPI0035127F61